MTFQAKAALIAAVTLLAFSGRISAADTVFRCGNSYSHVPCAQARVIDVDDARSESERAAARDVAAREARLALEMTRDRELAEARTVATRGTMKVARSKAVTTPTAPAATVPRRRTRTARNNEGRDFVAFAPKPAKPAATQANGK